MDEETLVKQATKLWKQKWLAWEIHRHLLSLGVKSITANKITLQVRGVDFTGVNSWSYS